MKTHRFLSPATVAIFIASGLTNNPDRLLHGQQGYQLPPPEVIDIIDAAPEPGVSFSPDRHWMLLIERPTMPSIEDVSRRMLRLAGMRIDPAANRRFQTSYSTGLSLRVRDGDQSHRIPLPDGARVGTIRWSHHSDSLIFSLITDQGQDLWSVSVDDPAHPTLLTDRLSTVTGGVSWMPDGKSVICQIVPQNRGAEPQADDTPAGPNIQESSGNKSPTRTYQDLLSNPHDEGLVRTLRNQSPGHD